MDHGRPQWDATFAKELEGSLVLVGMTYNEPHGPGQEQFFGTVIEAHPDNGIMLRLEGRRAGEIYYLPPDLRAFSAAPSGSYTLRETGEAVTDPDFTTSWTIDPPVH